MGLPVLVFTINSLKLHRLKNQVFIIILNNVRTR